MCDTSNFIFFFEKKICQIIFSFGMWMVMTGYEEIIVVIMLNIEDTYVGQA